MRLVKTSFESYDVACTNRDICLYVVNGMFLLHMIPNQLEIYVKLLKMLTLPSLAGFCEVLNIFLDVE